MTEPARRGRPGHSLDSLLAVAVAVFNERGYEATSMDELAGRLGITKSAIYHHVPGKGELLRMALDRALDGLFAVLAEPGASTGPAIARLEHVVRGSVRVLATELPFVTLVRAAVEEGSVRSDVDPSVIARLLFGAVNSLTEWYRPAGGLSPDGLADALVRTAFDGLRTD
jgi:AcrR family transcriptional regulator